MGHANNLLITVLATVVLWVMSSVTVRAELYPFAAKYAIFYHDVKFGNSERILRKLSHYEYQLTSRASVMLGSGNYENNSWFKLQGDVLTAQRYQHKSTVIGFSTVSSGIFDERGDVTMDYDSHQVKLQLQSHVIDIGAMTILLQNDLKLGKQNFSYEWVFEGEVKPIEFKLLQQERITTIFGEMQAIKLQQVTKKKRVSYLWFVPELDYQLAKIEVYKKNKRWGYLELTDLSFP